MWFISFNIKHGIKLVEQKGGISQERVYAEFTRFLLLSLVGGKSIKSFLVKWAYEVVVYKPNC